MAFIHSIRFEACGRAVELLNRQLLDVIELRRRVADAELSTILRGAPICEIIGRISEVVESYCDSLAERQAALGAPESQFIRSRKRTLASAEPPLAGSDKLIDALAASLAEFADAARSAAAEVTGFGDADTAAVLADASRGIDYHLWLLESHLDRSTKIRAWDARSNSWITNFRSPRIEHERRPIH